MQIYMARPGGQKEGPFTLDQINRDLAAGKYTANDYWAWHEGLPSWLPLHSLPGVTGKAPAAKPVVEASAQTLRSAPPKPAHEQPMPAAPVAAKSEPAAAAPVTAMPEPVIAASAPKPEPVVTSPASPKPEPVRGAPTKATRIEPPRPAAPSPLQPIPQPANVPAVTTPGLADATTPLKPTPSGMPFSALEQIFIFTSGEGRGVFESPTLLQKLQDTVGEPANVVREKVAVAVIGRLNAGVEMMNDDSLPEKAWRAMFAVKPDVAQQAKDGAFKFCVRTFLAESNDVMTLLLLYHRQKL